MDSNKLRKPRNARLVRTEDFNNLHEDVEDIYDGLRVILHDSGWSGLAIRAINGTGTSTVKGTVVSASTSADNRFIAQSNEFDSIGVVYEAGIADGQPCWIIIQGVADVLWKNTETSTRGHVAIAADTDGRALNIAVPSASPAAAEHFKEIGHVLETKNASTDMLVKCILHFN